MKTNTHEESLKQSVALSFKYSLQTACGKHSMNIVSTQRTISHMKQSLKKQQSQSTNYCLQLILWKIHCLSLAVMFFLWRRLSDLHVFPETLWNGDSESTEDQIPCDFTPDLGPTCLSYRGKCGNGWAGLRLYADIFNIETLILMLIVDMVNIWLYTKFKVISCRTQ